MRIVRSSKLGQWVRMLCLICLALGLVGCERQRVIVSDLDQNEANEIEPFLVRRGFEARKVRQESKDAVLYSIEVPASQSTAATEVLNAQGLPRKKRRSLLDTFGGGGLVPSEREQQIKYQAGLGEEIASSIRSFDGVLEAHVILSFPEENPLAPEADKPKKRASVFVKHNGVLDDPNSQLKSKIKLHVSGSVDGLTLDNVTVVGTRAMFVGDPEARRMEEGDSEITWVRVWSIIISKESLTRFRIVFFSMIMFVLFALFAAIWFAWKLLPVARASGGIGSLFSLAPLDIGGMEAPLADEEKPEKKSVKAVEEQAPSPEDAEELEEEE